MALPEKSPATFAADADLLAEYKKTRAQEVFAQIVNRHQGMVARTCYRLLGNQQDAEDATQTVFLVLSRHVERVDRLLVPWLHKVARDVSIQLLRSRTRRSQREQVAARSESAAPAAPPQNISEEIDQALGQLPAALREAVILRYLEGRSQDEAANLLGCPRGTLSQRASRGLDKLREILSRRGVLTPAVLLGWMQQEAAAAGVAGQASAQVAASVGQGSVTAQASSLADTIGKMLLWSKVKTAALVGMVAVSAALVVLVVTSPGRPSSLSAHDQPVAGVAYSTDGRLLASGDLAGFVDIWDMTSGKKLHRFATGCTIHKLSISSGRVAACGLKTSGQFQEHSGHVYVWEISSGQLVLDKPWLNWLYSVDLSPDGKTAAILGVNQAVPTLIDVASGATRLPATKIDLGTPRWSNSVAFAPDGQSLASGGWRKNDADWLKRDGNILIFDTSNWQPARLPNLTGLGDITFVCYSPSGRRLAAVDMHGAVRVWDVPAGKVVTSFDGAARNYGMSTLAFLDDRRLVAAMRAANQTVSSLQVRDLVSNASAAVPVADSPVSVTYAPAAEELAVGLNNGTIQFIPLRSIQVPR